MMAQELQNGTARQEPPTTTTQQVAHARSRLPGFHSRWNSLALITLGLRLCLTLLVVWAAWWLIAASLPLGAIRWAILVPAIAAANAILFSPGLDFESVAATRAARGASFIPDPWGGRSETIRIHAEAYVRDHGRRPTGSHVLQDIYSGEAFTVVYTTDETYSA